MPLQFWSVLLKLCLIKLSFLRKHQGRLLINLLLLKRVIKLLQNQGQKLHRQRWSHLLMQVKKWWLLTTMGIIKVALEIFLNTSHGSLSDLWLSAQTSSKSMFCCQLQTSGLSCKARTAKTVTERWLIQVLQPPTNFRTHQFNITCTRTIWMSMAIEHKMFFALGLCAPVNTTISWK